MRTSVIKYNKEVENEVFASFNDFYAKLNEVDDDSVWLECVADNVEFSESLEANPFEGLGGDEFSSVLFSSNRGWTRYPLRYTALSSILSRCELYGNGIKELFLADKEKFSRVLNDVLWLKKGRKVNLKALIQGGSLSALHSAAYKELSMPDIFLSVDEYLFDNFDGVDFLNGYWSYESSYALYSITDKDLVKVYQSLLSKHFGVGSCKIEVLATSSDVAETAVRFYPRVRLNDIVLPLTNGESVKHIGNVSLDTVNVKLRNLFASFSAAFRNIEALADIKIRNKKNAMIKAFTQLNIPQKYAAELCEQYDNTFSNALDVYASMCRILPTLRQRLSRTAALNYEESMARMVRWNRYVWESIDIPGVVAWGAKNK